LDVFDTIRKVFHSSSIPTILSPRIYCSAISAEYFNILLIVHNCHNFIHFVLVNVLKVAVASSTN